MPKSPKAEKIENKEGYTVYADFELRGKLFKKGETFVPPFDFTLDTTERGARRKGNLAAGVAFTFNGAMVNKEQLVNRVILPIE